MSQELVQVWRCDLNPPQGALNLNYLQDVFLHLAPYIYNHITKYTVLTCHCPVPWSSYTILKRAYKSFGVFLKEWTRFLRVLLCRFTKNIERFWLLQKTPTLLSNTEELLIYSCCTLSTLNSPRSMVYLKIKILIRSQKGKLAVNCGKMRDKEQIISVLWRLSVLDPWQKPVVSERNTQAFWAWE